MHRWEDRNKQVGAAVQAQSVVVGILFEKRHVRWLTSVSDKVNLVPVW